MIFFFDTLWLRITGNGDNTIQDILRLLKIPRVGKAKIVNIRIRI